MKCRFLVLLFHLFSLYGLSIKCKALCSSVNSGHQASWSVCVDCKFATVSAEHALSLCITDDHQVPCSSGPPRFLVSLSLQACGISASMSLNVYREMRSVWWPGAAMTVTAKREEDRCPPRPGNSHPQNLSSKKDFSLYQGMGL